MSTDAAPGEFAPDLTTEPMIIEKSYGDVEHAFRTAHAVVELDLSIGRHSGVPLETRGAIARYDSERDILELHGAAKVPHRNREQLARILQRPLSGVHLFESHVGGGFGVRGELYPEDVLVCLGALRLRRPVKWIEDRQEHFVATNHSRQQLHQIRAAVDQIKTVQWQLNLPQWITRRIRTSCLVSARPRRSSWRPRRVIDDFLRKHFTKDRFEIIHPDANRI